MKLNKDAVIEATQEIVRVAFFAALSAVIAFLLNKLSIMNQSDVVVFAGTLILKWVDKFIHDNPSIKFNGLTDSKIITG